MSSGSYLNAVLDSGILPHYVIRVGIRRQLAQRVAMIRSSSLAAAYESKMDYIKALRTRPMAIETDTANKQHYEVGTGVLKACLGMRMKYSCCLYDLESRNGPGSLDEAELRMMDSYAERAELQDGMRILDLGCGWGSLSMYLAARYPGSQVTAFSNSRTQKVYIDSVAAAHDPPLKNLTVVTGDIVNHEFEPESFDRVVSIELFEHMKNYALLMSKVSRSLVPGGKLFVHLFAHKETPYDFDGGWMTEHFFTGGTMLSADLLLYFQDDLKIRRQWWVNGRHYAQTCEDWLSNTTKGRKEIWPHLEETYGKDKASAWFYRWQIFYMACAEMFAYEGGDTWGVSHYLFEKAAA
ncbi:S-adenosyl-L-methionine-dependent methyltransferase [Lineolata rhizophorae]|uniref:S-adenosyl-L-methionine-dependent methyltransferase n=1 Tax=Lineolata rhizophorae TaxID=578093 RepID=A0A6A6NZ38_9PEZI|nr:S-adenosyl-L-methionine-dependent methyltransferase [Lineolata rhizophorae]